MHLDFQKYINSQLEGSSVIDSAISQVFGTSPTEMKLKEIGYLLEKHNGVTNFESYFDPRCLVFKYRAQYDGFDYYGAIPDEALRNKPVTTIVNEIFRMIMLELVDEDPEYKFENENEQAMLDAAMDYGFV